ncbi:MAG: ROK family protein [Saprospiraceae bacterium]|nr:ROK family protein [Saprospiraceae bacterium]
MGKKKIILGFDIGGTGIKAALVDVNAGKLLTEKTKLLTPQPSDPLSVVEVVKQLIKIFRYKGPIGCGFPAIIHHGVAKSAANIDDSWMNVDIEKFFYKETGLAFYVANDADVAGLAEVKFGKSRLKGMVIVLTIGTGIGSGMFVDGKLIPNTELGHLNYKESVYEHYVSNNARKNNNLSWEEWAPGFADYLRHLEKLFSPDLFVIGGGASSKFDRFGKLLEVDTPVIPAQFENNAGILGAAIYATDRMKSN